MPDAAERLLLQEVLDGAAPLVSVGGGVHYGMDQVVVDVVRLQAFQLVCEHLAVVRESGAEVLRGKAIAVSGIPLQGLSQELLGLPCMVDIGGVVIIHAVIHGVIDDLLRCAVVYAPESGG